LQFQNSHLYTHERLIPASQQRPTGLRSKEKIEAGELADLFAKKCQVRKIEPDVSGLTSENLKEWNQEAWENQMKPLMKRVPDLEQVWQAWVDYCQKLFAANR
jgi:hypothetical protein